MLAQNDWETTLQSLSESPVEKLVNTGAGSQGEKWKQRAGQTPECWNPRAKGTVEVITWPGGNHPLTVLGMDMDTGTHQSLKCQLCPAHHPGAMEGEGRGTSNP